MERDSPLLVRTKQFAVRVIRMVSALPNSRAVEVIAKQVLRSATSVGANYRAACRARSSAEFCAKLGIVEEEADESAYWLEILLASDLCPSVVVPVVRELQSELGEILAMTVASIRTARLNRSVKQDS